MLEHLLWPVGPPDPGGDRLMDVAALRQGAQELMARFQG